MAYITTQELEERVGSDELAFCRRQSRGRYYGHRSTHSGN